MEFIDVNLELLIKDGWSILGDFGMENPYKIMKKDNERLIYNPALQKVILKYTVQT